jgi:hypothetical protein
MLLKIKNSFQITIFEATKYPTKAQMHIRDTVSLARLVLGKRYDENQEPWRAAKVWG